MPIICPTVTEDSAEAAIKWLDTLGSFAERVHIDFTDGVFAPSKTFSIIQAQWPEHLQVDFHIMYQKPVEHLETCISLSPSLVVIHAEADGDLLGFMQKLQAVGIKAGIALLEDTVVEDVKPLIEQADHVLVFGGKLGFYGGTFRRDLLEKVHEVKTIKPTVEIGWDGGVSVENVPQLVAAGVDVCNAGGAVRKAEDPAEGFRLLVAALA